MVVIPSSVYKELSRLVPKKVIKPIYVFESGVGVVIDDGYFIYECATNNEKFKIDVISVVSIPDNDTQVELYPDHIKMVCGGVDQIIPVKQLTDSEFSVPVLKGDKFQLPSDFVKKVNAIGKYVDAQMKGFDSVCITADGYNATTGRIYVTNPDDLSAMIKEYDKVSLLEAFQSIPKEMNVVLPFRLKPCTVCSGWFAVDSNNVPMFCVHSTIGDYYYELNSWPVRVLRVREKLLSESKTPMFTLSKQELKRFRDYIKNSGAERCDLFSHDGFLYIRFSRQDTEQLVRTSVEYTGSPAFFVTDVFMNLLTASESGSFELGSVFVSVRFESGAWRCAAFSIPKNSDMTAEKCDSALYFGLREEVADNCDVLSWF